MSLEIVTVDPARLARLNDPSVHLISGSGSINGKAEACVMNWSSFIAGADGSKDDHPCVDPSIRRFCIGLNDSPRFAAFRDELKPYAVRVLNTRGDDALMRKRAYLCADWAVRVIAPMAIDAYRKRPDLAQRLRDVAEIVDKKTSFAARDVARQAGEKLRAIAVVSGYDYETAYAAAADAAARAISADFTRALWDASFAHLDRLIAAAL